MKPLLLLLSFIVCLAPCMAFAQAKVIDVIALEYPPFTTLTKATGGISFELLSQNTDINEHNWRPYFLPPKRAYKTIKSAAWCASFYPTEMVPHYIQYQLSEQSVSIGLVRLKQDIPFQWQDLAELSGKSVAILSTDANSKFARQFAQAGVIRAEVQTVQAGVQMVLLGRVDFAMLDDFSFAALASKNKSKLQFSQSSLLTTKLSLYVNPECDIKLPQLKVLSRK